MPKDTRKFKDRYKYSDGEKKKSETAKRKHKRNYEDEIAKRMDAICGYVRCKTK